MDNGTNERHIQPHQSWNVLFLGRSDDEFLLEAEFIADDHYTIASAQLYQ